jgi:hypothetical protein
MDERYRLLSVDEITSEHKKLARDAADQNRAIEKPESDEASPNLKRLNWIWLKLKKIRQATEDIGEVIKQCDTGGTRDFLEEKTQAIRASAQEVDTYMQAYNAGRQTGGKTGVYSLAQIRESLKKGAPQPSPKPEPIESKPGEAPQPGRAPGPSDKIRLKPIGDVYNEGERRIVLTYDKSTRELYIVNVTARKIIAHPRGIKELFTDEIGNRVIALVRCINQECYFVDTFNKNIISGPYDNVKEVSMVHQYKNSLLAQIWGLDGEEYFIDIYAGERFSF